MLKNPATAEATAAYAARFPALTANFRPVLGLCVSSIGIGTYLGEDDDETDRAYEEAIRAALGGGINLIDTAVNYRFQRSERSIGRTLAAMVQSGALRREEVVVATKGGFITFDGGVPPDPRQWFEDAYIKTGIIGPGDLVDDSHCMTPRYLAVMLEMSLRNLGLGTIDIYYVHNPETELSVVDRREFLRRIRAAFEFLEGKVAEGRIGVYATATWFGYLTPATDRTHLSLRELLAVAEEVGGKDHHFRVVQMPYSLGMPEALTQASQHVAGGTAAPIAAAKGAGLAVCTSAPLLEGRLTRGLPAVVGGAFPGLDSDAQRAVQFVRSTPGVDVALVGMKSVGHVREMLKLAAHPPAPPEAFRRLFRRE